MHCIAIRHVAFEDLGVFYDVFREEGITFEYWDCDGPRDEAAFLGASGLVVEIAFVHAVEVTSRYRAAYREVSELRRARQTHVEVRFTMYRNRALEGMSEGRVAANVDVFCGAEQVGGGRTAGPLQDMNDGYRILLEKNRTYTFRYENARGEASQVTIEVGEEPLSVVGYME